MCCRLAPAGGASQIMSRPRLVIAGGGHVGLAIAKLGVQLDYDVTVIDDRQEFANRERFTGVSEVVNMDMVKALEAMPIGWNSFVIVATRGHKLDSQCLRAAVKSGARYVGLLGSKRKTILIAQMLRGEGIPEDRIRAVHAPVGLDLGGRTPAEIALSVLAELSLERYGGSGRPLRDRSWLSSGKRTNSAVLALGRYPGSGATVVGTVSGLSLADPARSRTDSAGRMPKPGR